MFQQTLKFSTDNNLLSKFSMVSCTGRTISTGRMKRLGMAPVKLNGIDFVTTKNVIMRGEKDMAPYEHRNSVLNDRRLALDAKTAKSKEESSEKV